MRTIGIVTNHTNVRQVSPPAIQFGNLSVSGFPLGIEVEDECIAHPGGDAYKIDGEWQWRTSDGVLVPLSKVHCVRQGTVPCRCNCSRLETEEESQCDEK